MPTARFYAAARGVLALVGACPLLLAGAPAPAQPPPDKSVEVLKVFGRLTALDPADSVHRGCHHKVHTCALAAGTRYTLDLVASPTMAAYLRLEDGVSKPLAENNLRIEFVPGRTDTYRLVVSTRHPSQTGRYFLLVRSSPPGLSPPYLGLWETAVATLPLVTGDIALHGLPLYLPKRGGPLPLAHGYTEYRFAVRNASVTDSHRVRLLLPGRQQRSAQSRPHLGLVTATVEVQPLATAELALLQPHLPIGFGFPFGEPNYPTEVEVEIDGMVQEETLPVLVVNRSDRLEGRKDEGPQGRYARRHLLCGPGLALPLRQHIFKAGAEVPLPVGPWEVWRGTWRGRQVEYEKTQVFHDARQGVQGWSKHWLAYSGCDGIVAAASQLDAAPADVQLALWQYVECGGALVVVGPCKVLPPSWPRRQRRLHGLTACYAGLGVCLVSEQGAVEDWTPAQWRAVTTAWEQSGRPWDHLDTAAAANEEFPVVASVAVPVRGLFLSIVAFAVVIGPLNLYVLGRQQRRLWMLWTVPAFSLATCAAVVLYMLASEGWHGHVRAEGLTVLDEQAQRASTVGWIGFYTPLTPGDGLHFSRATELTPLLAANSFQRRPHVPGRTIDWTAEQHLAAGWVTARLPAHFLLRKSEARTERLAVRKDGAGTLTVTNELGAAIRGLWLADRQGRLHTAQDVQAGGQATLALQGQTVADPANVAGLRQAYAAHWLRQAAAIGRDPRAYLLPGCYVAVLDGAPFLEDGLRTSQSRKGASVVFGIMKEPGDAR